MNSVTPAPDFPLVICGRGVVAPTGFGGAALTSAAPPEQTIVPFLRDPCLGFYTARVPLTSPPLKRWSTAPRLRRASPLTLFMREAVDQALIDGPIPAAPPARLGLIACFWTGTMVYSRRFYEEVLKSSPRFAAPNLFPETVFNVALSHIAAELGVAGAAYALIGDEGSIATALRTARVWLQSDLVDEVLVIGAEEIDSISLEAYADVGWTSLGGSGSPPRERNVPTILPAEGAGVLRLRSQSGFAQALADAALPEAEKESIFANAISIAAAEDGHTYLRRREAESAAHSALAASIAAHTPIRYGTACNTWLAQAESRVIPAELRHVAGSTADPGHAFTASAVWQIILAAQLLQRDKLARLTVPLWGHNTQISTLQLCPQQHKNPYGPRGIE